MFQTIIKDFQSINEAKINVEGVTIIVGETNSGKSACLRAIEAACLNRFKMGQVQQGKDYAVIKFRLEKDGPVLSVARNYLGGSPRVQLGNHVYTKLGRSLPKEVVSYLNIGEVSINGERYSATFHPQFSKPMLMEYSQQKVMEILSASVEYDRLKNAKELVLSDRSRCKGAVEAVQKIVEDTRLQVVDTRVYLETIKPFVNEISTKVEKLNKLADTAQKVEDLALYVQNLKTVSNKIEVLKLILGKLTSRSVVASQLESVEKLTSKKNEYNTLCNVEYSSKSIVLRASEGLNCETNLTYVNNLESFLNKKVVVSSAIRYLSSLKDLTSNDYNKNFEDASKLLELTKDLAEIKKVEKYSEFKIDLYRTIIDKASTKKQLVQKITAVNNLLEKIELRRIIKNQIKQFTDIVQNHICPICGNIMKQ